jgi:hypothetical protein
MYQPPMYQPQPPKKSWYTTGGGIITLLVLFFPVGLYLMWRHATWNKTAKWIVTGFFVLAVIVDAVGNSGSQQAASHAATPTPTAQHQSQSVPPTATPTPKPTPKPKPTPTQVPTPTPVPATQPPACSGVDSTVIDGTCYDMDANGGSLVYDAPTGFCDYYYCVSDFNTATSGYVVECGNGEMSHSGGVSGACSRDGGVQEPLYQH